MHTILHPTDFSEGSQQVFKLICPLAREQHAKVIVLHVVCPDQWAGQTPNGGDVDQNSTWYRNASELYSRLCEQAPGVALELRVKIGPLVDTIIKVARRECCDMIALASFQHSYIERQYHGCVSESLSHVAPCPVLCLKESPGHLDRSPDSGRQVTLRNEANPLAAGRQW